MGQEAETEKTNYTVTLPQFPTRQVIWDMDSEMDASGPSWPSSMMGADQRWMLTLPEELSDFANNPMDLDEPEGPVLTMDMTSPPRATVTFKGRDSGSG